MTTTFAHRAIAALGALSMLAAQTPAQASDRCNGCNVRDEGHLNAGLIGYTVYVGRNRYTVTGVSPAEGAVFLRDSYGNPAWSYASETYTVGAQRERDLTAGAVAAVGVGILAVLFGGGNNSNSSSGSGQSGSSQRMCPSYSGPDGVPVYSPC